MRQLLASTALIGLLILGLVAPFSALAALMLIGVISLVANLMAAIVKAATDPDETVPAKDGQKRA